MAKQLPASQANQLPSTQISINVDMKECDIIETENKMISVRLDIPTGVNFQYATNKQKMIKGRNE